MPKLDDLCQQFWEEISSASPSGGQKRTTEEIVDIAYQQLQKTAPRDADVLKRHLLHLAEEMNLDSFQYDQINQLTDSLFG